MENRQTTAGTPSHHPPSHAHTPPSTSANASSCVQENPWPTLSQPPGVVRTSLAFSTAATKLHISTAARRVCSNGRPRAGNSFLLTVQGRPRRSPEGGDVSSGPGKHLRIPMAEEGRAIKMTI